MCRGRDDRRAFGPVRITGKFIVTPRLSPADEEELRAVGERVFDGIVIEILIERIATVMPAAGGVGANGPGILHPAAFVNLMDIEVAIDSTACPKEAVEAANLVSHLRLIAGTRSCVRRLTRHPVSAKQRQVPNLAGLNSPV